MHVSMVVEEEAHIPVLGRRRLTCWYWGGRGAHAAVAVGVEEEARMLLLMSWRRRCACCCRGG